MSSIREIIQEKASALREIDALGADQAAQELVELSALLASINKEVVERQYWYNLLCLTKLKESGVAAKAKIESAASQEWKDWQEAIGYQKATLDMIRSLKYFLRNKEDEKRESKF